MRKRSKYIVFLGPDGSGKTTVADELAEVLADEYSVRRINFSFGIMPSISRVMGRTERKAAPDGKRNAGMVKPLSASRAAMIAIWYGLDHVMGHWVLRRTRRDEVVIFARSYHDFLYQRAYLNLPEVIPRLFLALGPKPELVVAPQRDPHVIHNQKPELTVEEIEIQYCRIFERLSGFSYFAGFDTSEGIAPAVSQIRERLDL